MPVVLHRNTESLNEIFEEYGTKCHSQDTMRGESKKKRSILFVDKSKGNVS